MSPPNSGFNSILRTNEILVLQFAPVALAADGGMGWDGMGQKVD